MCRLQDTEATKYHCTEKSSICSIFCMTLSEYQVSSETKYCSVFKRILLIMLLENILNCFLYKSGGLSLAAFDRSVSLQSSSIVYI